jgi:DNA methylase
MEIIRRFEIIKQKLVLSYRSVAVVGAGMTLQHQNNVELGRYGRNRSNVWTYPGVNTFGRGRMDALTIHPTVKPVALVADALLDCTSRGDVVLDQFAGAGTTILAAEKVGRIAYAIEYEPRYVDAALGRWQRMTKLEAVLAGDGRTFEEITEDRVHSRGDLVAHRSKPLDLTDPIRENTQRRNRKSR